MLSGPLKRFTSKTIVSRAALRAELATIRKNGCAVDDEEMEEGARCLAVPIFDRRRQCVGTLSVSGPTTRLTTERVTKLAPSARLAADELSRQLGNRKSVSVRDASEARIIDASLYSSDEVHLGATVKVKETKGGQSHEFTIVGSTEADPTNRRLSNESPLGAALIGRKKGDVVEVNTPRGVTSYKIEAINSTKKKAAKKAS